MTNFSKEAIRERVEEYIRWDPVESTQKEIQALLDDENWEELEKRIMSRLTFGTAGLGMVLTVIV